MLTGFLQSGGSQSKWNVQSQVGVYLENSKQHASRVALLVLNPITVYILLLFHCVYNNTFNSAKMDQNITKFWAEKAGLNAGDNNPRDYRSLKLPVGANAPFTLKVHIQDKAQLS